MVSGLHWLPHLLQHKHKLIKRSFLINTEKSQLTPSQVVTHLAAIVDSVHKKLFLPPEKVAELKSAANLAIASRLQSKNGKQNTPVSTATVSMVHSVPELMQAEQLGREDQNRLRRNRKLVLMVDLDQTLIHTTEQHCQQMSNKGIFHFQLGRGEPMLHTRLRPHCKEFLEKIAKLYELHVFTFGSRLYAHTIAEPQPSNPIMKVLYDPDTDPVAVPILQRIQDIAMAIQAKPASNPASSKKLESLYRIRE
ncbi:UNVERIFIED_CONTAM: hypothetical protein K2H54_056158 [Gekko kuhli]